MGASGSGKSTLAYTLANILSPPRYQTAGEIHFSFSGSASSTRPAEIAGQLSMIFQAPYKSLNPLMSCGAHLVECISLHQSLSKQQTVEQAHAQLQKVRLASETFGKYPHQLSGGQIQRVMIALALSQQSEFLIADEPTASLDVDTEQAVLSLIKDLQQEKGFTLLLITHDLRHVQEYADRILLLEQGQLVEDQSIDTFSQGAKSIAGKSLLESALMLEEKLTKPKRAKRKLLLNGQDISVVYESRTTPFSTPKLTRALTSVDISLYQGECMGIMGISGSGKSSLVKAIKGMVPMMTGELRLHHPPIHIRHTDQQRPFPFHAEVQLISQLNEQLFDPRQKIIRGLKQVFQLHASRNPMGWEETLIKNSEELGLGTDLLDRYPHQLSGGQLQRANILRALMVHPSILICDEILSQLDMPIKTQILSFLKSWLERETRAMLFISHDEREINHICHDTLVLQEGKPVYQGEAGNH